MSELLKDISDLTTRDLLGAIVRGAVKDQESFKFLATAGQGKSVMNRVRMELTRSRQRMERQGRKYMRFTLKQSIFPWTSLEGNRFDCVVITSARTSTHEHLEMLDDLIERKGIEL